jgi:hypothetical protein
LFRKGTKGVLEEIQAAFMRLVKWLEDVFGVKLGFEKKALDNILGEGLYGGKILSKTELEDWAKLLKKKYGTKLQKVDKFENPKVLAAFDGNTNTIKYTDNVTDYILAHESFHAEHMSKIGKEAYFKGAPLKGVEEAAYTTENWLNVYMKEKYVYDKLVENADKLGLNSQENWHTWAYIKEIEFKLIERNIKVPK